MKTETKSSTLLFVYGTLKSGGPLNHVLTGMDAVYCGDASIKSKDYILRDLDKYPGLHYVGEGKGHVISGELWVVETGCLPELDAVEGMLFGRKYVVCSNGADSALAMVYYIKDDEYAKILPAIPGGEWENESMCLAGYEGSDDLFKETDSDKSKGIEEFFEVNENVEFTVEKGVFVVNELGEFWGPFDDIQSAVKEIAERLDDVFDDPTTLTIGFRMVRQGLSQDELADLDSITEAP